MHLGPIERIDTSDVETLRAAVAVETRATRAVRPSWTPLPVDARLRSLREPGDWSVRLLGVRDGNRLAGVARTMIAADTPGTGWVFADVDPACRRRGVGTALVRAARAGLPATVERLVARAYHPDRAGLDALLRAFAAPLGFTLASSETVVELSLTAGVLPRLVVPTGYEVRTYVDGVPDALREAVGRLIGRVDAEAPNGTLAWEPTPVPPAEYAAGLRRRSAQGSVTVETLALAPDGTAVAWTGVVVPPGPERPAAVEGTFVEPAHRGRGLGAAVKGACLARLRDPLRVHRVSTSSDDANRWMRAINHALGFRPVEVEALFESGVRR